ncbi:MAG TPA: hypothetical protein VMI54_27720 [Polyangiaceae bacterium]|nr:hypothetical protein [Polyangiaceae bacterium]
MAPKPSAAAFSPEFQRAFVAVRYFLGARGEELGAPLGDATAAAVTEQRLAHPDRERRAEALAAEIGRVVRALEARVFR